MSDDNSRPDAAPSGSARPRPEYGEYATPEEQRARIQQPDLTYALETGQDPERVELRPHPTGDPHAPAPAWVPLPPNIDAAAASRAGRRRIDVIVAMVLLGYGLVQVVLTSIQSVNFSAFAQQFMTLAGISGDFTNLDQGRTWGLIGAIAFSVGWILTALVVFVRARHGRTVWWVPVVGAAISFIVLTTCLMVPLLNDPAITSSLLKTG
ncbi:DUF6264 family protein [Microbacterium rhizomatis]|uniref:Uncharacterized protein n=1 Tax=Microbacterium rhizomatis TaxID=1631477 RepID=A0A5J5J213_9MICO|nr:DUF6264 family protein [Microbacterium rhizomatis]KAA9110141.1 hypothetical protein F6B43_00055 [Microbacterium rhizomatis]